VAKVFLSSTHDDLREYRAAAFDVLRRIGHEPIAVEAPQASGLDPLLARLQPVAAADLVIVIVARRYGHIPLDERISMVETEYEYAVKAAKPVLVFLLDDSANWPAEDAEVEPSLLQQFRTRLAQTRVVSFFHSLADFQAKLAAAVERWAAEAARGVPFEVTLDQLPLAWRLVAGSFAEPELLHHLDPAAFVAAIEKWEEANNADKNAPWVSRLARAGQALDSAQTNHEASSLWIAWMRATRPPKATGDTESSKGAPQ
jgi:hypothetical protein